MANDDRQNNMFYRPTNFDDTDSTSQADNSSASYGSGYQSQYSSSYNSYQTNSFSQNPYSRQNNSNSSNSYNQPSQSWNSSSGSGENLSSYPPYQPNSNNNYQTNQTYQSNSYQTNSTYQNNNYQTNSTYQNNGYQANSTYQNNSYQNNSYQNNSYSQANQTYQNDTYQGYDNNNGQMFSDYQGSSVRTVEVPIERKMSTGDKVLYIGFAVVFLGMFILVPFIMIATWFVYIYAAAFVGFMVYAVLWTSVFSPRKHRKHIEEVCTVTAKGRYVGYDKQRHRRKNHTYYTYAPKYKIFVNDRYEIRTLDEYTRDRPSAEGGEIDFLINPSGYEIKRAFGTTPRENNSISSLVAAIAVVIILLMFILPMIIYH